MRTSTNQPQAVRSEVATRKCFCVALAEALKCSSKGLQFGNDLTCHLDRTAANLNCSGGYSKGCERRKRQVRFLGRIEVAFEDIADNPVGFL